MKLYLLRHAEAAEGTPDAGRPLTQKGIAQSRAIGQFLAGRGIKLDAAFTSPLVRAVETAEYVLEELQRGKKGLKLHKTDHLLNECSTREFEAWLKELSRFDKVLMVGHNPSLSLHLARLLHVQSPATVSLPKGGLAVVRLEGAQAVLKLFLTPKQTGLLKE
ncbi:MAG: phosphohistidine phosphatase SixA [Verrucomicrobiae bacterium]|nr:phosphohistidine phosphatase SixA [Verrucomicrobiae bacterium]